MERMNIDTEYIKLDQFLKFAGIADNGGFAKLIIQNGDVSVNGEVELQRGKKLRNGDIVKVSDVGEFMIIGPSGE